MVNILVIEDDESMLSVIQRALTRSGYQVLETTSAREALTILARGKIQLVITDLIMPDMDGLELIQRIRDSSPAMPILAISGGGKIASFNYLEIADVLGATRIMAKPFEVTDLLQVVLELLNPGS